MEVTGTRNNVSRVEDNMSNYVDIISFNNYLGWYGGSPEDCKTRQWEIPYDKPFLLASLVVVPCKDCMGITISDGQRNIRRNFIVTRLKCIIV